MFECQYSEKFEVIYFWVANGIRSTNSKFPSEFMLSGGIGSTPAMLTILAMPQFNATVVQCGAFLLARGLTVLSRNSTLIVGKCWFFLLLVLEHNCFTTDHQNM